MFFRSSKSVIKFKFVQELDSSHICGKFSLRTALAQMHIGNGEIVLFLFFGHFLFGFCYFNRLFFLQKQMRITAVFTEIFFKYLLVHNLCFPRIAAVWEYSNINIAYI